MMLDHEKVQGWLEIQKHIFKYYRRASNISHTFVGTKIVDHSAVVGASPVGAAPTTSSSRRNTQNWENAVKIFENKMLSFSFKP